jgi:hypothetical protein
MGIGFRAYYGVVAWTVNKQSHGQMGGEMGEVTRKGADDKGRTSSSQLRAAV